MSYLHFFNVDSLKHNFSKLIEIDKLIYEKKDIITENLNKLKNTYNNLIKHNSKKIFLFCLDSFYFQYKILNMELENLNRFIILINNRMYGDYYKLYNIIMMQTKEKNIELPNAPDSAKIPIYKDLEPFREYKIDDIEEIHKKTAQSFEKEYYKIPNVTYSPAETLTNDQFDLEFAAHKAAKDADEIVRARNVENNKNAKSDIEKELEAYLFKLKEIKQSVAEYQASESQENKTLNEPQKRHDDKGRGI